MKRIFVAILCCLSASVFAATECPKAAPIDSADFCSTFKTSAVCHCTEKGMPSALCQDTKVLYNRMIAMFGSLDKACAYQKDTTKQSCIDDWNCYLKGGKDSQGKLCNNTGLSCPT